MRKWRPIGVISARALQQGKGGETGGSVGGDPRPRGRCWDQWPIAVIDRASHSRRSTTMAAHHLDLRSDARPLATVLPRRAVLRVALAVLATLVVGLAPGLPHNQASAVTPARGNLNFVNQTDTNLGIAIS